MTQRYLQRLQREYVAIQKNPPPYIAAAPRPDNILEWHYCLFDIEDPAYAGGFYHGKLVFPREYPMKPPAIYMLTPNGRFAVNQRLCLSMSDFHPDQWNPAWTVESILKGLLSFMLGNEQTAGSITTTLEQKRKFAAQSLFNNLRDDQFVSLFPELSDRMRAILRQKRSELLANDGSANDQKRQDQPPGANANGREGAIAGPTGTPAARGLPQAPPPPDQTFVYYLLVAAFVPLAAYVVSKVI